jgi:lipopolysaccharide/colanic/teichoic acid biosynthesis glycosyltransferase
LVAKRLFDILISVSALTLLSPLYLLITVLIKMDSKGPIHFRAVRVGKDGKLFTLFKFRTMVMDAVNRGPGITRANDPRMTRIGKLLRKSKLDEVPQLLNVIRGEMSLIGPRPEDPKYVSFYSLEQRRVLTVRPGLSSPAVIKYRDEEKILEQAGESVEELYLKRILPDKLKLDLSYVDTQSFWLDLVICFKTAMVVVRPHSFESPHSADEVSLKRSDTSAR